MNKDLENIGILSRDKKKLELEGKEDKVSTALIKQRIYTNVLSHSLLMICHKLEEFCIYN